MIVDAKCECGKIQTSSHLFECILIPSRCIIKYIIGIREVMDDIIGIIDCWEKRGI